MKKLWKHLFNSQEELRFKQDGQDRQDKKKDFRFWILDLRLKQKDSTSLISQPKSKIGNLKSKISFILSILSIPVNFFLSSRPVMAFQESRDENRQTLSSIFHPLASHLRAERARAGD
jgi:hypothetical protein